MSSGNPTNSARRSKSYASGKLTVNNGIATVATTTGTQALTTANFTGSEILTGGVLDLPRAVTVTLSSHAGSYTTNPIVITGTRSGKTVTQSLTPSGANGNETLRGTQAFDKLTGIAIPAQNDALGQFSFGVGDICSPAGDNFCGVELAANGTLNIQYGEQANAPKDAITLPANAYRAITPSRILTDPGLAVPTTVGITVYLP